MPERFDLHRLFTKIAWPSSWDACWLWSASRTTAGYGNFRMGGKVVYGHRVAYEAAYGPIPDGLQIDHLCRVRHCVNPLHLEAVTQAENLRRGENKYTHTTHCVDGHPLNVDNLRADKRRRVCRECANRRNREYRRRRSEIAGA